MNKLDQKMEKLIMLTMTAMLFLIFIPTAFAATIDSINFNVGQIHEGQDVEMTVTFNGQADGKIVVYNNNEAVVESQVTGNVIIPFRVGAPLRPGTTTEFFDIDVAYFEGDERVSFYEIGQSASMWIMFYVEDGEVKYKEIVDTPAIPGSSDWGSLDFRVLKSNDKKEQPVQVVIENKLQEKITVDLKIHSIAITGDPSQSKIETEWNISPGKNTKRFDFKVTDSEKNNDVQVIAVYDGKRIAQLYNSFVRLDPVTAKDGDLPPKPGEMLDKEMKKLEEETGFAELEAKIKAGTASEKDIEEHLEKLEKALDPNYEPEEEKDNSALIGVMITLIIVGTGAAAFFIIRDMRS